MHVFKYSHHFPIAANVSGLNISVTSDIAQCPSACVVIQQGRDGRDGLPGLTGPPGIDGSRGLPGPPGPSSGGAVYT